MTEHQIAVDVSDSQSDIQNPLLAAANANRNPNGEDDALSDYVPDSRDLSVSRAVSRIGSLDMEKGWRD